MAGVVEKVGAVSVVEKKGYLYLRASLPVYSPIGAFEKLVSKWITLGMKDDGSKGKNRQLAILRAKELDYDLSRFRAGIPFPLSKWDTSKQDKTEGKENKKHSHSLTLSHSSHSLSLLPIYQEFYRHKVSGVRPNTITGYNAYLNALKDMLSTHGASYLTIDNGLGGRVATWLEGRGLQRRRVKQYLNSYSKAYEYWLLMGSKRDVTLTSTIINPFTIILRSLSILQSKRDKSSNHSIYALSQSQCVAIVQSLCDPYHHARRERERESRENEESGFSFSLSSECTYPPYLPLSHLLPIPTDCSPIHFSKYKTLYLYGLFCQFSLLTGCRPMEGFALRPIDIHLTPNPSETSSYIEFNGIMTRTRKATGELSHVGVRITGLKTQDVRRFPVNPQLHTFLSYLLYLTSPSCPLFPTIPKTSPIFSYTGTVSYRSFALVWKRRMVTLSDTIPTPTPYAMRHTFITRCLQEGVPVADVAKWVGNSPSIIYKHYAAHNTSSVVPVL